MNTARIRRVKGQLDAGDPADARPWVSDCAKRWSTQVGGAISSVRFTQGMAQLVYIDETGSSGKGAKRQPLLTLAAVIVDEDKVKPLAEGVREIAWKHLQWVPATFELHGVEIWNGKSFWNGMPHAKLIEVYEDSIAILQDLELESSHASIHKDRLRRRYGDSSDQRAYLLALQFLLEKIDAGGSQNKILVADEAKEHELTAIKMVADMQDWAGRGEVPGRHLKTIIDSMHFVSSHASPGVQMADVVAFALQRHWNEWDKHPDAKAGIARIVDVVWSRTFTWREPWPRA